MANIVAIRMVSNSLSHTILVVLLVILAGCTGGFADDAHSPTITEDEPDGPSVHQAQNISVTNNWVDEVVMLVYIFQGDVETVNLTYANGSVRTDSKAQYDMTRNSGWPSVIPADNVTSIEPVNTTEIAYWSAVVSRNATVSLPTPVERQNVSYLFVVRPPGDEPILYADVVSCTSSWTLDRYVLEFSPTRSSDAGEWSSRQFRCS